MGFAAGGRGGCRKGRVEHPWCVGVKHSVPGSRGKEKREEGRGVGGRRALVSILNNVRGARGWGRRAHPEHLWFRVHGLRKAGGD